MSTTSQGSAKPRSRNWMSGAARTVLPAPSHPRMQWASTRFSSPARSLRTLAPVALSVALSVTPVTVAVEKSQSRHGTANAAESVGDARFRQDSHDLADLADLRERQLVDLDDPLRRRGGLGVDATDVSGVEPPVAHKLALGDDSVAKVGREHGRPGGDQQSGLADRKIPPFARLWMGCHGLYLMVRESLPDHAQTIDAGKRQGAHAGRLRQSVPLEQLDPGVLRNTDRTATGSGAAPTTRMRSVEMSASTGTWASAPCTVGKADLPEMR